MTFALYFMDTGRGAIETLLKLGNKTTYDYDVVSLYEYPLTDVTILILNSHGSCRSAVGAERKKEDRSLEQRLLVQKTTNDSSS
jgi:hypothetical protein